jgi:hypothetical protein
MSYPIALPAVAARMVTLRYNAAASVSALEHVVDQVFSSDYFTVMEQNDLFDRDKLLTLFRQGQAVFMVVTQEQCTALVRMQTEAENDGITEVFDSVYPSHVHSTSINFCERCGSYHEDGSSVFSLGSLNELLAGEAQFHGDAYGLVCDNCDQPAHLSIADPWISSWDARHHGYPSGIEEFEDEYGPCDLMFETDTMSSFISMQTDRISKGMPAINVQLKQLSLAGLMFDQPLTKEQHDAMVFFS